MFHLCLLLFNLTAGLWLLTHPFLMKLIPEYSSLWFCHSMVLFLNCFLIAFQFSSYFIYLFNDYLWVFLLYLHISLGFFYHLFNNTSHSFLVIFLDLLTNYTLVVPVLHSFWMFHLSPLVICQQIPQCVL